MQHVLDINIKDFIECRTEEDARQANLDIIAEYKREKKYLHYRQKLDTLQLLNNTTKIQEMQSFCQMKVDEIERYLAPFVAIENREVRKDRLLDAIQARGEDEYLTEDEHNKFLEEDYYLRLQLYEEFDIKEDSICASSLWPDVDMDKIDAAVYIAMHIKQNQ